MPIGMYIILNGMFFIRQCLVIVLIRKPKLKTMTRANINSGSFSVNSESVLIEACRKGDQKAQLQIYKLHYKTIYGICLQIVNDPDAAEDIMHESFLSAFENINTYRGNISFTSWITKFIKNTI